MINANTRFFHISDGDFCIYFLLEDRTRLKEGVLPRCKIGITHRLDCALRQFRTQILRASSAEDFEVFNAIKTPSKEIASSLERRLHVWFAKKRCRHSKEWFDLSASDIEWCRSLSYDNLEEVLSNHV
jgi:hypothetical protein